MKHLKKYNDYNESLKNKLATGLLGLGMAACTTPPSDTRTMDQVHRDSQIELNKSKPESMKDVDLPTKFEIDQDILSIGNDFHISSDSGKCGVIEERVLSWGKTFEFLVNGVMVSRAEERVVSWGTNIDVYDADDNKLGSIEEEILDGMFSVRTIYSIKDASGNVVGKSKKLDFIGTDIDIYDTDGNLIATMERPMVNLLSDSWSVNIKNDLIDKRILVFIPCYKTDADDQRKNEEDN